MTKTAMATHLATRAILRVTLATRAIPRVTLATRAILRVTLATRAILRVTLATRAIPLDIQVYLAIADILAFRPATLVVIREVIQATVCWRTAF